VALTFRTTGWSKSSAWVFVLLALLTFVPAACVLWFMNDALARESDASRRRVLEAYRGQLRLVRARLDPLWRAHAGTLDADGAPERQFARLIGAHAADGLVLLDRRGTVVYPDRGPVTPAGSVDIEHRLTALAGMSPGARAAGIAEIAAQLNDYTRHTPAPARLALMDRLRELERNVSLPTQDALRLSLDTIGAERLSAVPNVIRQTAIPDIWALTSEDTHVIALYRTGRLEAMMHDFLHQIASPGILFVAYPPEEPADREAIAAGPWLPGWQISFAVLDGPSTVPGDHRGTVYLAVGLAGVLVVTLTGVAVGQTLRRHLRVARMKTDLVAAASHELRTPLASMRVLVDGLLAETELDPAKTREYLEMMATENARLSRLIENFLTFSRLERRRYPLTFAPVHPSVIVGTAIDAVRDRLSETSTLEVDVPSSLPAVLVDREAVSTALVNLLDNALKYTPADKRIVVRACGAGDGFVQFTVSDNGIGIPVREHRRIFKRFHRVDRRLARETGGVGLGLSIVELIAREHGGTVTVRSEPGEGSTFTLRMPRTLEKTAT